MLDHLSPQARHRMLLMICAALSMLLPVVGERFVPWLAAHPGWGPIAGAVATALIAQLTPLVRQYGTGSDDEPNNVGSVGVRLVVRILLVTLAVLLLAVLIGSAARAAVLRPPVAVASSR